MPELPDVEVMRRYLQSTALHQEIKTVDLRAEIILEDEGEPQALQEALVGRSFESTQRHGKWLFASLNEGAQKYLVLHFGMTGGLKYTKHGEQEPEYTQALFRFVNGYQLAYISMRKLGELEVIERVADFIKEKDLGPDALAITQLDFKKAVEGRRIMAKSLLMDQETLAGIGNVYSDEILFQAGIHPRSKINGLDAGELENLFATMKEVLQTAIKRQAEPEKFPENYITPHRHAEGRCPRCGAELQQVQVGSRHSYFCPNRQGE